MSAFSPLNLAEDASRKDLEEEHTRELEVENAFREFQAAMALHSAGAVVAAYTKYRELGNSPVIVNHYYEEMAFVKGVQNGAASAPAAELGFLPQNVKAMRYLYFRNRGFLFLRILQSGPSAVADVLAADADESTRDMSAADFAKDLFYTMVDGFVSCLVYQEPDAALLRLLHDIFAYLDIKKLVRTTLEYAVSFESETDDVAGSLPLNGWARPLWRGVAARPTAPSSRPELREKLRFLHSVKADFDASALHRFSLRPLRVAVKARPTWAAVVAALNAALKDRHDKERVQDLARLPCKHMDPYYLCEEPVDSVTFDFTGGDDPDPEPVPEEPVVEEAEDNASPSVEVAELPPADEKTMRLSKRLNPGDSGPIATDNIVLVRGYFVETEAFFAFLNDELAAVYADPPVLQDVVGHIVTTNWHRISPLYAGDFLKTLNEWKPKSYDRLLSSEKETQVSSSGDQRRLIEVLTSFGNQYTDPDVIVQHIDDAEDHEYIRGFLGAKFATGRHAQETKLEILRHLMGSVADKSWPQPLFEAVADWVLQLESDVFTSYDRNEHDLLAELPFALGLFEILINAYITTKEYIEATLESGAHLNYTKAARANFNAQTLELVRLNTRVEKWACLFEKAVFSSRTTVLALLKTSGDSVVRYYWASNYFVAAKSASWSEKKYVVVHLNTLNVLLDNAPLELHLPLPNYSKIGEFTVESLHRRLSTASILSIFCKILAHSPSSSNNDTVLLLESILVGDVEDEPVVEMEENSLVSSVIEGHASLDRKSLRSVKDFFNECPVDLKLSLWKILFSYYEKGSFSDYQKGFEHYLEFVVGFIESTAYAEHKGDRGVLLLTLLEAYSGYSKVFLAKLQTHRWRLPEQPPNPKMVTSLCRIFELCYCFSLHEEAALITSRKISLETKSEHSFNFFKSFCVESITMILVYYVNHMGESPEKITNILVVVHNQIGLRRLCDASSGIFLKCSQDLLLSLESPPAKELTQLMSCRFHYKIKLEGQFPIDHYTDKSADLNKNSAEELVTFILPLCFKRNALTHTPRNDLRQVVEDLYEIIGDPDTDSDKTVAENIVTLEKFLEQTAISPRFTKEAFFGLQTLDFFPPNKPSTVAKHGLYYFEAVLMFNFYKIRKKSAQSRIVELEKIISLLTVDLVYGSQRVESWALLAQAYGFIVEDDLIWTSDKINIIERKVATANLQRKSLLCYIMAISHMTRQGIAKTEASKAVVAVLMNAFVRELYSAIGSPMDSIAFKVSNGPKFVRKKGQNVLLVLADKPSLSTAFCLTLMHRCLVISTRMNPAEWSAFYYLAKVQGKLKQPPAIVLGNLLKACELAIVQSLSSDRLMEPAYKFFSMLYKYVKSDKLTTEDGFRYMNMEPTLKIEASGEGKKDFYEKVICCLDRIKALDKKSWYHKPAYRKAVIKLDEFGDVAGAEASISDFFTLRSNNKTFLSMWKPENERPGKHFVYMFQYTQFYIGLLARKKDLSSLGYMFPKLRRANSTMVSLYFAWEQMCSSFCKIVRDIARIEDGCVERFLGSYVQARFVAQAKIVTESVNWDDASESVHKYLVLLFILVDMRKLNNGFGPTSLIDDTFAGLFVKIYSVYVSKEPEFVPESVTDSPNGKIKKLAKKDLFPFAVDMCTKCKRNVETFVKEKPDLLNEYVSAYVEEEANLEIRRSLEKAIAMWKVQQREGMKKMIQGAANPERMRTPQPQQNAVFGESHYKYPAVNWAQISSILSNRTFQRTNPADLFGPASQAEQPRPEAANSGELGGPGGPDYPGTSQFMASNMLGAGHAPAFAPGINFPQNMAGANAVSHFLAATANSSSPVSGLSGATSGAANIEGHHASTISVTTKFPSFNVAGTANAALERQPANAAKIPEPNGQKNSAIAKIAESSEPNEQNNHAIAKIVGADRVSKSPVQRVMSDSPDSSTDIFHDASEPRISGVNLSLLQADLREEICRDSQQGNTTETEVVPPPNGDGVSTAASCTLPVESANEPLKEPSKDVKEVKETGKRRRTSLRTAAAALRASAGSKDIPLIIESDNAVEEVEGPEAKRRK